jgi:hypothetical protein
MIEAILVPLSQPVRTLSTGEFPQFKLQICRLIAELNCSRQVTYFPAKAQHVADLSRNEWEGFRLQSCVKA